MDRIFRLILPAALFRLCGGRVENLGELQPLAVKAGINGVMMGNFLTTLGSEPEDDRAMFEDLGLNVARQDDNGANPRPDNRSGWLDSQTPRTPVDDLIDSQDEANYWNPAVQLRRKKTSVPPRPDGAPNAFPEVVQVEPGKPEPPAPKRHERDRGAARGDRARGLYRRLRCVSSPQVRRVLLDGRPVLLLCSNNYLGLADHPRVREAAAEAAMRYGAGSGASRLISGNMTIHRRLEEQLAAFKGAESCLLFGSVSSPTPASSRRSRARATWSSPTRSTTRRSSTGAGCRAPRRSSTTTATSTISSGACARPRGAAR